jgi:hypothetical protein
MLPCSGLKGPNRPAQGQAAQRPQRVPRAGLPSRGCRELMCHHRFSRKQHSGPKAHRDGILNGKESACLRTNRLGNLTACSVVRHHTKAGHPIPDEW